MRASGRSNKTFKVKARDQRLHVQNLCPVPIGCTGSENISHLFFTLNGNLQSKVNCNFDAFYICIRLPFPSANLQVCNILHNFIFIEKNNV